jgi:hypothetical protein
MTSPNALKAGSRLNKSVRAASNNGMGTILIDDVPIKLIQ